MRILTSVALTGFLIAVAACGSSDNSKIEKVINGQLAKASSCVDVPIGQKVDYAKVGPDGALAILKSKGYITESQGSSKDFLGRVTSFDSYALTEAGKPLVQREASILRGTCLRTGHYEIAKIEAVDVASDASGQPIAKVRARLKFIPEDWIASTEKIPAWAGYWKDISTSENVSWLYSLLKSGSDYFTQGPGQRLK